MSVGDCPLSNLLAQKSKVIFSGHCHRIMRFCDQDIYACYPLSGDIPVSGNSSELPLRQLKISRRENPTSDYSFRQIKRKSPSVWTNTTVKSSVYSCPAKQINACGVSNRVTLNQYRIAPARPRLVAHRHTPVAVRGQ